MIANKRVRWLSALLFSISSATVSAASLKEVAEAVKTQDYKTALEQLEVLAKQEHPEAEFLLGMMYQYGRGVEQNFQTAADWFRRSANKGNNAAQTNLALLLISGKLGKADYKEAVSLLEKATATGNPVAIYNLGLRYSKGEGVQKDSVKAVELFRKASDFNNAFAQYNLAYSYATGEGTKADNAEALKWAHASAQQNFGQAIVFYNFLASKATPEEIQKGDELLAVWAKERGIEVKPVPQIELEDKAGAEGAAAAAPAEGAAAPAEAPAK